MTQHSDSGLPSSPTPDTTSATMTSTEAATPLTTPTVPTVPTASAAPIVPTPAAPAASTTSATSITSDGQSSRTQGTSTMQGQLIEVAAGAVTLPALLHVPDNARGLVVLTHGIEGIADGTHASALAIAQGLHQTSLATLVVDLFSDGEQQLDQETGYFRVNTSIMEQRIMGIAEWAQDNAVTSNLGLGYFGAGAAGAAVLIAAAERPDVVTAVVAAGASLDLAHDYLPRVLAPTLLIASQQDENAVKQHQQAMDLLTREKRFEPVAGVNALFSSQDSIAQVAQLAGTWFGHHLEPIV